MKQGRGWLPIPALDHVDSSAGEAPCIGLERVVHAQRLRHGAPDRWLHRARVDRVPADLGLYGHAVFALQQLGALVARRTGISLGSSARADRTLSRP